MTTYLLQEDVFVDDSLVPLGVEALACVFGPPLVFSAGGTHHNKIHLVTDCKSPVDQWTTTTQQAQCSGVGHNLTVEGRE